MADIQHVIDLVVKSQKLIHLIYPIFGKQKPPI